MGVIPFELFEMRMLFNTTHRAPLTIMPAESVYT